MKQYISLLLFVLMGITIIPWQLLCLAHPFGHDHHEYEGPSPCELRKIVLQQPGEHLLPPMDCAHISDATDKYNQTQTQVEKKVPNIQMIVFATVFLNLDCFEITEPPFLLPPVPNCRSATIFSDSPLRAPPLV